MIYRLVILFFLFTSFQFAEKDPFIIVLGTTQDAGYPQIGCDKECCKKYWDKKIAKQKVSCLALFDPSTNQKWIFDATPDLTEQLHDADKLQKGNLSGIFLTHAQYRSLHRVNVFWKRSIECKRNSCVCNAPHV